MIWKGIGWYVGLFGKQGLTKVDLRGNGRKIFAVTKGKWKRDTTGVTRLYISTEMGEVVCESGSLTLIA